MDVCFQYISGLLLQNNCIESPELCIQTPDKVPVEVRPGINYKNDPIPFLLFWELFGVNLCSLFGVTAKTSCAVRKGTPASAATIDAAQGVVQAAGSVITQYPSLCRQLRQLLHAQALRQIALKDLRQIIPKTTIKEMNIAQIREALLWCVILNICLVIAWSILVLVAKGWLNGIILKWFRVSAEQL